MADFGQTDFGQTEFDLFCVVCGVWCVCVFVCLCVFMCVCCVVWVLVSRFHGVGFHLWVLVSRFWSCSVVLDRPSPLTALPRTALPQDGPIFRSLFPSIPAKFVLFFPLWGSSRGILVVFEELGLSNVHARLGSLVVV